MKQLVKEQTDLCLQIELCLYFDTDLDILVAVGMCGFYTLPIHAHWANMGHLDTISITCRQM